MGEKPIAELSSVPIQYAHAKKEGAEYFKSICVNWESVGSHWLAGLHQCPTVQKQLFFETHFL